MSIELESTENIQTFDICFEGKTLDGEITNRSLNGKFCFKSSEFQEFYTSEELKAIADKLDELNK